MYTTIIAELGINHNGDLDLVRKMIDVAADAGSQIVKFQKRTVDVVYTEAQLNTLRQSPWGNTMRAQKYGLELSQDDYECIDIYCREKDMTWIASAWDLASQEFLQQFNLQYNKVASPMLAHIPLLEMIAGERRHTFISTGMSNWDQIDDVVTIFEKASCSYTLMHCVSVYPCPPELLNLYAIPMLKKRYVCPVGYSGHEVGVMSSVIAVVLGAEVVERHITLDRSMYGTDQSASLEPEGLRKLVKYIKTAELVLKGDGEKEILESEIPIMQKLRENILYK